MVKGVWVEELADGARRTDFLKNELKSHGYKLSSNEFAGLLKGKLDGKTVSQITSRKVCVVGPHQTPTMIAAGTMRLNNEYGFYFTILRTGPGGYPEMRLVIEDKQEFERWFDCFVGEFSFSPTKV